MIRLIYPQPIFSRFSNIFCGGSRSFSEFVSTHHKITKLQPGLILIKNGLTLSEQMELAEIALNRGEDPDSGFWKIDSQREKILNQAPIAPHRGRIFDALETFPPLLTQLCIKNLERASQVERSILTEKPTHSIVLYYQTLPEAPKEGYIPWHVDKDPNDGDDRHPVVSFTIGDSCEFLVCNSKPQVSLKHPIMSPSNLVHRVTLESGDVLIFSGDSRKIHHAIYKMLNDTAPKELPFQGARINFTFRYAPKILGEEQAYSSKNFLSVYHKKQV